MSASFLVRDVLDHHSMQLGESPVWLERSAELMWVDLERGEIWAHSSACGASKRGKLGTPVGAVSPLSGGGFILATREGFVTTNDSFACAELRIPISPEDPTILMNDGKCDPRGRFWAGTMDSEGRPHRGALMRLEPPGRAVIVIEHVSLSNDGRGISHGNTASRRTTRRCIVRGRDRCAWSPHP